MAYNAQIRIAPQDVSEWFVGYFFWNWNPKRMFLWKILIALELEDNLIPGILRKKLLLESKTGTLNKKVVKRE